MLIILLLFLGKKIFVLLQLIWDITVFVLKVLEITFKIFVSLFFFAQKVLMFF